MGKPLCKMNLKELLEYLASQEKAAQINSAGQPSLPPIHPVASTVRSIPLLDARQYREILSTQERKVRFSKN